MARRVVNYHGSCGRHTFSAFSAAHCRMKPDLRKLVASISCQGQRPTSPGWASLHPLGRSASACATSSGQPGHVGLPRHEKGWHRKGTFATVVSCARRRLNPADTAQASAGKRCNDRLCRQMPHSDREPRCATPTLAIEVTPEADSRDVSPLPRPASLQMPLRAFVHICCYTKHTSATRFLGVKLRIGRTGQAGSMYMHNKLGQPGMSGGMMAILPTDLC